MHSNQHKPSDHSLSLTQASTTVISLWHVHLCKLKGIAVLFYIFTVCVCVQCQLCLFSAIVSGHSFADPTRYTVVAALEAISAVVGGKTRASLSRRRSLAYML